jgi:hypothetical protein
MASDAPAVVVSTSVRALSDPFNGEVHPKAIPGAVVAYAITVENRSAEAVDDVRMAVPVPAQLVLQDESPSLDDTGCGNSTGGESPPSLQWSGGLIEARVERMPAGACWTATFRATVE